MSWYYEDAELLDVSIPARWMYAVLDSWCRRNGPEVSLSTVAFLAAGHGVKSKAIEELTTKGIIKDIDWGYELVSRRSSGAERQARYRDNKRVTRYGGSNANVTKIRVTPVTPVSVRVSVSNKEEPPMPPPVQAVFDAWVESVGKPKSVLIPARVRVIKARLAEGYTSEDLIDAVRGWVNDPWKKRVLQNELTILLRSGAQVEKFKDLWRNGAPALRVTPKIHPVDARVRELIPSLAALGIKA